MRALVTGYTPQQRGGGELPHALRKRCKTNIFVVRRALGGNVAAERARRRYRSAAVLVFSEAYAAAPAHGCAHRRVAAETVYQLSEHTEVVHLVKRYAVEHIRKPRHRLAEHYALIEILRYRVQLRCLLACHLARQTEVAGGAVKRRIFLFYVFAVSH